MLSVLTNGQEVIISVEKLMEVNSSSDELMPVFSPDGQTMFFVRGGHNLNDGGAEGGQDIWFSKFQPDSTWGAPSRFEQPLNNEQDNSVCGVSKDGETLFLDNIYDSKKKMHPGLSWSTKTDADEWSKPQKVEIENFNPKPPFLEFSFPSEFPEVLLISMEHQDTSRLEDLYVSTKSTSGTWSTPKHMGDVLNSSGYEISPFLAKDGKTLFFGSSGHGGEGQCDIFKSTRLDNSWTNWSKPENLGPIINSNGFDAYYTIDPYGRAYFVRGNLSDGDDNIYVVNEKIILPVPEPEPVVEKEPEPVEEPVFVPTYDKQFEVYFGFDDSGITPEAKVTMTKVLDDMNKSSNRRVVVVGHTCDKGNATYNQRLSERRTKSVLDYLRSNGISESRIEYDSKGFSQPKNVNDSEVNRAKNRRAEIHVFEELENNSKG